MRFSIASALLSSTAAYAFSDTTPFVLLSPSQLDIPSSVPQLQSSKSLLTSLTALLSSCPTTGYLLVSQPNLHAADIRDPSSSSSSSSSSSGCRMPNLCRAAADYKSVYAVSEVVGPLGGADLAAVIDAACASAGKRHELTRVELRHLPAPAARTADEQQDEGAVERRKVLLADNDYELGRLLSTLGDDFTVLLFSDPSGDAPPYEPEFVEPIRTDLRRAVHVVGRSAAGNQTYDDRALFEKYQFFTSGTFMGLIAAFVLISILYVGLRGLSSLEVSYGAFEKEMGPAAQKKQL